ncbi:hypothetical protein SNEBB_004239 [Seison nebaliae]|nr:hypothetical protein SNEBB_004239 [Seison nebaliae]
MKLLYMRIYNIEKQKLSYYILWISIGIFYSIVFAVGYIAPPMLFSRSYNESNMYPKPLNNFSGPFTVKSPLVSIFNQYMWCYLEFDLDGKNITENESHSINISYQLVGVQELPDSSHDHATSLQTDKVSNRAMRDENNETDRFMEGKENKNSYESVDTITNYSHDNDHYEKSVHTSIISQINIERHRLTVGHFI